MAVTVSISFSETKANEIYISQSGDNFDLFIDQIGDNHKVQGFANTTSSIVGDTNTVTVKQKSVNTDSSITKLDINGDTNTVTALQGYGSTNFVNYSNKQGTITATDSLEAGEHTIIVDIVGDNNDVYSAQRNGSGFSSTAQYDDHSSTIKIYGDNNAVGTFQGHDGAKTLSVTINNDNNDVDLIQMGYDANHTASVTLGGSYGTDLYLMQNSANNKSYSLNQNCMTSGGCSVSLTQN